MIGRIMRVGGSCVAAIGALGVLWMPVAGGALDGLIPLSGAVAGTGMLVAFAGLVVDR